MSLDYTAIPKSEELWCVVYKDSEDATLMKAVTLGNTNTNKRVGAFYRHFRTASFPYLLVAPIGLLILGVSFYPTVYAFWLAMTNATLLELTRSKFVGLSNFIRLANDPVFIDSAWRTLRWDIVVVGGQLLIALPISLLLNLNFRGRGLVRAAVLVPYILPQAVTGLIFVYMFDGNRGVVNDLLVRLDIIPEFISWLGEAASSFAVVSGAMIWSGMPLMAIILLAALQTIPADQYEAAAIDGADSWQRFWHVTLPHLMPTIAFLVLLRIIWMSNNVDMIFVMTGGGPGFSNYTTAVYSFVMTTRLNISYSSAIAVCLSIILIAASLFYVRHLIKRTLS